ncbi:MAG: LacI family DNA-binding transcriptional regulator [Solobacterium sp.]|nr:LacI family DNA-binding transcriptional regulator [Solobacterium sp.]
MTKKVTIQDIADALGISRNTVSKAINNSEGIADSTREKIIQKAVEMGYKQFSYVASIMNIVQEKEEVEVEPEFAGEIALLTGMYIPNNHFGSLMMDKFHQEISQMGYTLTIHRVTDENVRSLTFPKTFNPERVSGVLCMEVFDYEYSKMICECGIPLLFVDGPAKAGGRILPCDMLLMDSISPITDFTFKMIERGLMKIGFIGDYKHCQSFYERYSAYILAMTYAGLKVDKRFLIPIADGDISGLADYIENMDEMPDIFICANDFVAIDAMQILYQKDRKLRKQVRFLGFDDTHESRIFYPSLSTVHIHSQTMAYSAVQLLMSRMKEPSLESRVVHVETDLVLRDSTEF